MGFQVHITGPLTPRLGAFEQENHGKETMLLLRKFNFSDADYEVVINLHKKIWGDTRHTVETLKYTDANTPVEKYDWLRIVAEWESKVVGYGIHFRALDNDVENQYSITFVTSPEYRRRGIATAYFDRVQNEFLVDRNVSSFITQTRSDQPEAVEFLEKREFELQLRRIRSELFLDEFDFLRYEALKTKMRESGIRIRPLSELMKIDPDYQQKLRELEWVTLRDQPHAERPKRKTLAEFVSQYIETPNFLPEGWFVATDGDHYVGWSAVLRNRNRADTMNTGITVVERQYRRQGIATAMKLRTFEYVRELGKVRIEATNAETNPMLQLNMKLGFRPIYAWLEYKKIVSSHDT